MARNDDTPTDEQTDGANDTFADAPQTGDTAPAETAPATTDTAPAQAPSAADSETEQDVPVQLTTDDVKELQRRLGLAEKFQTGLVDDRTRALIGWCFDRTNSVGDYEDESGFSATTLHVLKRQVGFEPKPADESHTEV